MKIQGKRCLAWFLCAVFCLAPIPAYGEEELLSLSEIYINPLYADIVTEEDLLVEENVSEQTAEEAPAVPMLFAAQMPLLKSGEMTRAEALEDAREQAEMRNSTITVTYRVPEKFTDPKLTAEISDFWADVLAHNKTEPTQGDYLKWQYPGYKVSAACSDGNYVVTLTYTANWYTTAAQEQILNASWTDIMIAAGLYDEAGAPVENLSDWEKIVCIYDYLCRTARYDHIHDKKTYLLQYTAYSALIDHLTVCQGYSLAFYRMALDVGVDARLVGGFGNGGNHAWNIVAVGDAYYCCDATWDAGTAHDNWKYFLAGTDTFYGQTGEVNKHTVGADSEEMAPYNAFLTDYAVSESQLLGLYSSFPGTDLPGSWTGRQVAVPIWLQKYYNSLTDLTVTMVYDHDVLTLTEIEETGRFGSFTQDGDTLHWAGSATGERSIQLATAVFTVNSGAAIGGQQLTLQATGVDGGSTVSSTNSTTAMQIYLADDVNGDGAVDVLDMACLYTYLSEGKQSGVHAGTDRFSVVANTNSVGGINILDYQYLYEKIRPHLNH